MYLLCKHVILSVNNKSQNNYSYVFCNTSTKCLYLSKYVMVYNIMLLSSSNQVVHLVIQITSIWFTNPECGVMRNFHSKIKECHNIVTIKKKNLKMQI